MRIEVKTRNNVKVLLDLTLVKGQRKVIDGNQSYFQVTLVTGSVLVLGTPIPGLPLEEDVDITRKPKVIRVPREEVEEKRGGYIGRLESAGTKIVPRGKKPSDFEDQGKYTGEMIYTHKTAPEIAIYHEGAVVVDVDVKTMYKGK